jgi:hypothetical protein
LGSISRDIYYRPNKDNSTFYAERGYDVETYSKLKENIRKVIEVNEKTALTCNNVMKHVHNWGGAKGAWGHTQASLAEERNRATIACDQKGKSGMARLKECISKFAYNAKAVFDRDGSRAFEDDRKNINAVISEIEGSSAVR